MAPVTEHSVASFAAGLAEAPFPAVGCHHRVRALVHHARSGEPIDTHPLTTDVVALRRGLALLRARQSSELTAYDGNLTGLPIPSPLHRIVSPTELEAWMACPYAYLVRYVLGVRPVEAPDAALRIRPLDLGSLVHEALDAFHQRVLRGDLPQPGPTGWTDVHVAALLGELAAVGAQLEAAGRVGRPASWTAAQARLRDQLRRWLADDGRRVVATGAQVIASEVSFGTPHGLDEATIPLGGGRTVRFGGTIDRVDRCADGTLVVLDHKTGSNRDYAGIDDADPTAGGRKLQLPAYAAAVQPPGDPVRRCAPSTRSSAASSRSAHRSRRVSGPRSARARHHRRRHRRRPVLRRAATVAAPPAVRPLRVLRPGPPRHGRALRGVPPQAVDPLLVRAGPTPTWR